MKKEFYMEAKTIKKEYWDNGEYYRANPEYFENEMPAEAENEDEAVKLYIEWLLELGDLGNDKYELYMNEWGAEGVLNPKYEYVLFDFKAVPAGV